MAAPTAGPYGTTGVVMSATGADGPCAEMTIEQAGFSTLRRLSNQLAPAIAGGTCRSYFSTFGTVANVNQEIWGQIITQGAAASYFDFIVHYAPSPTPSFFEAEIDFAAGTDQAGIYKMAAGVGSQLGSNVGQEFANGSYYCFAAHNTNGGADVLLEQFLWNGAAWGTAVGSQTAAAPGATLLLAGYFGAECTFNSALRLGDIRGGAIVAASGAHRQSVAPSIAQSIAPSIGGGR